MLLRLHEEGAACEFHFTPGNGSSLFAFRLPTPFERQQRHRLCAISLVAAVAISTIACAVMPPYFRGRRQRLVTFAIDESLTSMHTPLTWLAIEEILTGRQGKTGINDVRCMKTTGSKEKSFTTSTLKEHQSKSLRDPRELSQLVSFSTRMPCRGISSPVSSSRSFGDRLLTVYWYPLASGRSLFSPLPDLTESFSSGRR